MNETSVDMCHNGHPFEPGVDTDMAADGREPSQDWCNVCGNSRGNAERNFWAAFEYDSEENRWLVAPRMSPMDVLEVCVAKVEADRATVAALGKSIVTEVTP